MTPEDLVKWFNEIESMAFKLSPTETSSSDYWYPERDTGAWCAAAEAALAEAFPAAHPCRRQWQSAMEDGKPFGHPDVTNRLLGIFVAALHIVKSGRAISLATTVRSEAISELIEQSEVLLSKNYLVPAAVIVGGALETFLSHYVERRGLTITGDGSISKYNGAVGKARNEGIEGLYTANEGQQIEAWRGTRNEAAHTPGDFNRTQTDVRRMIEGIRDFLARHAER